MIHAPGMPGMRVSEICQQWRVERKSWSVEHPARSQSSATGACISKESRLGSMQV